jgi:exodeoxyribonuclease VII small subunit
MAKGRAAPETPAPDPDLSFEERLRRLEEIVAELERGGESLERALELFEEGTRHTRALTAELDRAQARIDRVLETAGGTRLETFESDGTDDGE